MLTVAGAHVPEMPLSETDGNVGAVDPEQIDAGIVAKSATGFEVHKVQVAEAGGWQGTPITDVMVKVTLWPFTSPNTSQCVKLVFPVVAGPPLME